MDVNSRKPWSQPARWLAVSLFSVALLLVAIEVSAGSRSLRISGADDRIVVPNSPQLNPPGAITIEAWVRPGGTTFCRTIVDKNRTSGYSLAICNGKLRFYTSGLNSSRDGVSDIPIGEWTHVAVTFDGVRRVYYINGIIDFEADTPAPLPVNTSELFIGGAPSFSCGFSSCNFIGDIAEVRVWDVARSRSDIREDIAVQISEPRDGLAGLWHLENSARESFGRYASVVEGDATFLGLGAPPVRDNPLRIPRMLVPDFDGRCDNYTSNLRIPVWNEGPFERLQWLNLGASGAFLYACLEGMQFSAGGFAALYIDPTNDATTFAQPDDFRAVVTSGGSFFTEAGAGNSGGFMPGGPAGVQGLQDGFEFFWSAEFRVPRSVIEQGDEGRFRLQAINDEDGTGSISGDWGWPTSYFWDWPARYEEVVIDPILFGFFDDTAPEVSVQIVGGKVQPVGVTSLKGVASDQQGVSSITVFFNGAAQRTCSFSNFPINAECVALVSVQPGRFRTSATVTNRAGVSVTTGAEVFRVLADGNVPQLSVDIQPRVFANGGVSTVTAVASDPSGVTSIVIDGVVCSFSGDNETETCVRTIESQPGRLLRRVRTAARDSEDLEATNNATIVWRNQGFDADQDGLSNNVEDVLCTSPTSPDTDGDSLPDGWEILGVAFDDPSGFIDLPGLGANPCRKDIFLQYDYEVGARVRAGVVDNVVAAFRRNGITLHVSEHERPRPTDDPVSPLDAAQAAAQTDENGDYFFDPIRTHTHYYAYSRHRAGRSGAWGRTFTFDIYGGANCSCPLSGIDPALCGLPAEPIETGCSRAGEDRQTRTFMHELGHSIGLGHGGQLVGSTIPQRSADYVWYDYLWDDTNRKPNYRGQMNYAYYGNVCLGPGPDFDLISNFDFSQRNLGDLVEQNLDERPTSALSTRLRTEGCNFAVSGSTALLVHTCADPNESMALDTDLNARRSTILSDGLQARRRRMHGSVWTNTGLPPTPNGIDFDCDGVIEPSVASNVNGAAPDFALPPDNEICGDNMDTNNDDIPDSEQCAWTVSGPSSPLRAHTDWDKVPRALRCITLYSRRGDCYPQSEAYRDAIQLRHPSMDCRPSGAPNRVCSAGARVGGSDGTASVAIFGIPDQVPEQIETEYDPAPADMETCDGFDNDGDLEVDEGCRDTDGDGIADSADNCPTINNPDQSDIDLDRLGDVCDDLVMGPIQVSDTGQATLELSWTPVAGAIGYALYRSNFGGTFEYLTLGGFPSTQSSVWTDPLPQSSTAPANLQYRMHAVDANGSIGEPVFATFSTDDDLDGIRNPNDNCLLAFNPDQRDSDADGFGNVCDADIAPSINDCVVNVLDLGALRTAFFATPASQNWNPDADFNGDDVVNFLDLGVLRQAFFQAPGPSGTTQACEF